jgi:hypothetical protein
VKARPGKCINILSSSKYFSGAKCYQFTFAIYPSDSPVFDTYFGALFEQAPIDMDAGQLGQGHQSQK